MRKSVFAVLLAVALTSRASAWPHWVDPLKTMSPATVTSGFFAPNYVRSNCDPVTEKDDRNCLRQHLGTDFRAARGDIVRAPVDGQLGPSNQGGLASEAYISVIDGQNSNEIHILGHVRLLDGIDPTLPVYKGEPIATVLDQGSNTHFHWGYNVAGWRPIPIHRSRCFRDNMYKDCDWGWGKAPYETKRDEAVALGWRPVL